MSTDLISLAEERCGFALSDAERVVLNDLQAGRPTAFPEEREIRSRLLRWLLTSEQAKVLTSEWGVRLDRVVVTGDLDLRAASIVCDVRFRRVRIEGDVMLQLARTRSLIFQACHLKAVDFRWAQVDGTIVLGEFEEHGCRIDSVSLRDTRVSGSLDIRYSRFVNRTVPGGPEVSLDLVRAAVEGSVFVAPGNSLSRGIDAQDIHVKGNLNVVDLDARQEDTTRPTLDFSGARIDGSLILCRPRAATGAAEAGRPFEYGHTTVEGVVAMQHARIGGNINLNGLSVRAGARPATLPGNADRAWWGLDLLDTEVAGSVWLHEAAAWNCGVRLSHLRVGGNVECLDLVMMRERPATAGQETPESGSAGTSDDAARAARASLDMAFANVAKLFLWKAVVPDDEIVNLSGSTVGTFEYSSGYWPARSRLEGFGFTRLIARSYALRRPGLSRLSRRWFAWSPNVTPGGVLTRWIHARVFAPDRTHLAWVRTSSTMNWEFDEALYERLADTLTQQGQADDARRVLIARTNDRNAAKGWLSVLLGLPYRLFAGNGYRPKRAVVWAIGLIALGAVVFAQAYAAGTLVPVGGGGVPQPFQPVVYSADTLLPIVDLHQERSFEAAGPGSEFVRLYLWVQIALGWVIATTLGAAAASFVRRVGAN